MGMSGLSCRVMEHAEGLPEARPLCPDALCHTIVPCGGAAANCLGLTTQNPVRDVYVTSGPNRRLRFGSSVVPLRHAPSWQLVAPHRKAGDVIRALEWLGPEEVEDGLKAVLPTLSEADRRELADIQGATLLRWQNKAVTPGRVFLRRTSGLLQRSVLCSRRRRIPRPLTQPTLTLLDRS